MPVESITPDDIEKAKLELLEGSDKELLLNKNGKGLMRKPAGVNRYISTVKRVFSYAVKTTRKMKENPALQVKYLKENNERVRWLSDEEEKSLFAVLPKQYHAMVLVALNTGLRKSEQLRLQWMDIEFRLGQITIREGKNGKSRVVPMNSTLRETLERIPGRVNRIGDTQSNLISKPNPYVFASDRKPELPLNELPREWERYLTDAGIENFHLHDLRHTFASRLVMSGVDLYTFSKLLGHQSLAMTQRYAHLAPDYLKSAVFALENRGRSDTRTDTDQEVNSEGVSK